MYTNATLRLVSAAGHLRDNVVRGYVKAGSSTKNFRCGVRVTGTLRIRCCKVVCLSSAGELFVLFCVSECLHHDGFYLAQLSVQAMPVSFLNGRASDRWKVEK